MPEFLAETYAPRDPPGTDTAARRVGQAALAADQVSQPEARVRLLGAIVVAEEETCFYLYQASSACAVRAAVTRAGLRPDRITQAAWIRPPRRTTVRDRPGRFWLSHPQSIHLSGQEHTDARNHPVTADPPAQRAGLLPGPARQRVDHRPPPAAASLPRAAGGQRQRVPARKEHPMARHAL